MYYSSGERWVSSAYITKHPACTRQPSQITWEISLLLLLSFSIHFLQLFNTSNIVSRVYPTAVGWSKRELYSFKLPWTVLAHRRRDICTDVAGITLYYRNNLLKVDLFSNLSVTKRPFQTEELMIFKLPIRLFHCWHVNAVLEFQAVSSNAENSSCQNICMKLLFRSGYLKLQHAWIPSYSTCRDCCVLKLHSRNHQNTRLQGHKNGKNSS